MNKFIITLLALNIFCVAAFPKSLGGNVLTVTESNSIIFRDSVSADSIRDLSNELLAAHLARKDNREPIYLFIDSPGGSIVAGQEFIDFASTIPNVVTVNQFAASMAAGIIQALPGRRLYTASSALMFHRASGQLSGQFEDGEMESQLAFYKKMVRSMELTNALRLKMSLAAYKAAVKDELWLYGDDIKARNGGDKKVKIVCDASALKGSVIKRSSIDLGFISLPVVMKVSKCPLLRTPEYLKPTEDRAKKEFNNQIIERRKIFNKGI
jgi:ATP-dependent Clp protease, protease subunit